MKEKALSSSFITKINLDELSPSEGYRETEERWIWMFSFALKFSDTDLNKYLTISPTQIGVSTHAKFSPLAWTTEADFFSFYASHIVLKFYVMKYFY